MLDSEFNCPRCWGYIPNNSMPGMYPGAWSRVSDIEICSACGEDEAIRDFLGLDAIPADEWPMEGPLTLEWEDIFDREEV